MDDPDYSDEEIKSTDDSEYSDDGDHTMDEPDEEDIPEKKLKMDSKQESRLPVDILQLFNDAREDKVIFKWTESELKELLLNYIRFMVFKAAFPDIESNPESKKNLFKSYKLLNTEINGMCNFMITHLDLPEELVGAVKRHSQRIPCYKYINENCVVCRNKPSYKIQYLGSSYHKNDLKIEKTTFPPQGLLLCTLHTYISDTFFSLIHMKWNIHLNIEHQIKHLNIPYLGNKNIVGDIGNAVITNLAAYYFHIISRLKSSDPTLLNFKNGCSTVVFRDALRSLETKTRYEKVAKK